MLSLRPNSYLLSYSMLRLFNLIITGPLKFFNHLEIFILVYIPGQLVIILLII